MQQQRRQQEKRITFLQQQQVEEYKLAQEPSQAPTKDEFKNQRYKLAVSIFNIRSVKFEGGNLVED